MIGRSDVFLWGHLRDWGSLSLCLPVEQSCIQSKSGSSMLSIDSAQILSFIIQGSSSNEQIALLLHWTQTEISRSGNTYFLGKKVGQGRKRGLVGRHLGGGHNQREALVVILQFFLLHLYFHLMNLLDMLLREWRLFSLGCGVILKSEGILISAGFILGSSEGAGCVLWRGSCRSRRVELHVCNYHHRLLVLGAANIESITHMRTEVEVNLW